MNRDDLISPKYVAEQRRLHAQPRGYGGRGSKWAEVVVELASEFRCSTVLDYGCGQGSLAKAIRVNLHLTYEYDPAIPGKDAPPVDLFDLVVCTDVLEHVESDRINAVLSHLASLTGRALFVVIALVPTSKKLSDGRQAHILLRSVDWWKYIFAEHGFKLSRVVKGRDPLKEHKQFAAVFVR
jgi:2-polyprenyl-3-methyl-5-hydroxy-6-metoxy-1,4-benzoquinol methylase